MVETGHTPSPQNRRCFPRYAVEEMAQINLLDSGTILSCGVQNLSEGGCLLESTTPLGSRIIGKLVEASFQVNGMGMRFNGTVIWQEERCFGIRFAPCLARRKEQLVEAIDELQLEIEREKARRAAEEATAHETPAAPGEQCAEEPQTSDSAIDSAAGMRAAPEASAPPVEAAVDGAAEDLPVVRERRQHRRHVVDGHVTLYLVKSGIKMRGLILDVSQGGCRLATDERFPLGIYTRCEVEFTIDGLPFRLPGVVQAIHDHHRIGIRLIDLSPRKQGQLQELIEELDEKQLKENAVAAALFS